MGGAHRRKSSSRRTRFCTFNSEVKHDRLTGKYVKYTGEVLNKAERATYKQYRHRHVARCRLGDDADKLSRICRE